MLRGRTFGFTFTFTFFAQIAREGDFCRTVSPVQGSLQGPQIYLRTLFYGSKRPENCPVDSFQRRTGGSPGSEASPGTEYPGQSARLSSNKERSGDAYVYFP